MVAHAYNPSYLGGRDQKDQVQHRQKTKTPSQQKQTGDGDVPVIPATREM
jgi:hypothetical protein